MLNSLLSTSTQKQIIGVSLTPGIGLEACVYDRNKNNVLNYGRRKVEYNFSTREIQNYTQFKTALSDLVSELNLPPKSLAYLVLPNVYFDFLEIPKAIEEHEIQTAVLSKAEEFYIFKKDTPVSGWCDVVNINDPEQRKLVCSSYQSSAVENLRDAFTDVGLQLVGIETNYSATIRGLYSIGLLDDVLSQHLSWTVMIVNTSSFTLMYFDSDNLIDFREVPVAIKSFSAEEAYGAIASSASQLLDNFASSKLFIISQTDDICADVLKRQMMYDKEIEAIDTNRYSKQPIINVLNSANMEQANSMTLGAIGASNIKTDFNFTINVLADDPSSSLGVYFTKQIFGTMVDVTQEYVQKICGLTAVACFAIFGLIAGLLYFIGQNTTNQIEELGTEINNVKQQIEALEGPNENKQEIDINQIIDEIAQVNVKTLKFYDSMASDMPKNIWLTKYYNKSGDTIAIKGVAENMSDIYEYFKNLKIASPESDIKLNEIMVMTEKNDLSDLEGLYINNNNTRLYSFEISNLTSPLMSIIEDANKKIQEQQDQNNNNENQVKQNNDGVVIRLFNSNSSSADEGQEVEKMSRQAKPVR